jgi:WD40 repeat protein
MMAISCGKEQIVKIFRLDGQNNWQPCETLTGSNGTIRDVAWAPNMGRYAKFIIIRSYQLIATASTDGNVRIYHLIQNKNNSAVIILL